jgi:hypothetical protein
VRPQEVRRYPDEQFYFDGPELVVDREVLPEVFPEITNLDDQSIVATYRNAEGEVRTREHAGIGWSDHFQPGQQLLSIQTGTGEVSRTAVSGEYWQMACTGDISGEYEVQPGDLLITKRMVGYEKSIVIVPADEPMPAPASGDGMTTYEPLGVITNEGSLVAWGDEGAGARHKLDLAIANKLVNSRLDNYLLHRAVDRVSLLGLVSTCQFLETYLDWFKGSFGQDYKPDKEPSQRWDEFPGMLTAEQLARYRAE